MDISEVFGKCLTEDSTGKRLPSIGYEITSEDEDVTNHAFMCGYRHFLFGPEHGHVIANLKRHWSKQNPFIEEDLFLTLKMPVIVDKYQGIQHTLLRVLSQLNTNQIDMVMLYNNGPLLSEHSVWNSKWMELESVHNRGMVKYLGLMTNNTQNMEQIYRRCRKQPHLVTYSLELASDSEPQYLASVQPYCTKHDVKLSFSLDMDALSSKNNSHGLRTPKVIGRTLMQSNIPYTISSTNLDTIEESFQVYDCTVKPDTVTEVLSAFGLNT